jgi:hypothetical protein
MNPNTTEGKNIVSVAVGTTLTISAGYASASLDKLAYWFLAGFGASLSLILTNLNEIYAFIPIKSISYSAYLFLWGSVFCVIQRYIAMVISSCVSSSKEGRELGEKFCHMDIDEFITQMKAAIPCILRPLCNGLLDDVAKKDFAAVGQMLMRLSLYQGLIVLIEVIVLLIALSKIVSGIQV